jgi:N-acetyl-anhydromuramyl-L-alanine amidase AmpD
MRTSTALRALGGCAVGLGLLGLASGPERTTIDTVVIHTIGGPSCSDAGEVQFRPVAGDAARWKRWFEAESVVGIHYIVDRSGTALASIPESQVANHVIGHNDTSIGIELVNAGDGVDPFPSAQIDGLVTLLCDVLARNGLTASAIKGHADLDDRTFECGGVEARKKVDPGALFPWQDVLERAEACLREDDAEEAAE